MVKKHPIVRSIHIISASPVKPLFKHRTVRGKHLGKGTGKYLIVVCSSVIRMVPVPRRNINAKFKTVFTASQRKFFKHISLSFFPRTFPDCMGAELTGPETKAIVMLCRNYDRFHPCFTGSRSPLPAIQGSGIKNSGIFLTCAPFPVSKGVRTKVNEHIKLHVLALQLCGRRYRNVRFGAFLRSAACQEN